MAVVNALVTLPNADAVYRGLAELSWPGFAWLPQHLVQPVGAPYTVALITWELGIAALLMSKGRAVRLGLFGALLQLVGLAPFLAWYELANLATAVVVVALLPRSYDQNVVDVIRRRSPTSSASTTS